MLRISLRAIEESQRRNIDEPESPNEDVSAHIDTSLSNKFAVVAAGITITAGLSYLQSGKYEYASTAKYPEHLALLHGKLSASATRAFNEPSILSRPPFSMHGVMPQTEMFFCTCFECTGRQRSEAAAEIAIAAYCIEKQKQPKDLPVILHDFGSGGMAQNFVAMNLAIQLGLRNAVLRVSSLDFAPAIRGSYKLGVFDGESQEPNILCTQDNTNMRYLPESWDTEHVACKALRNFAELLHESAVVHDAKIVLDVFGSAGELPPGPVDIKSAVDSNSDVLIDLYNSHNAANFSLFLRTSYHSTFGTPIFDNCSAPDVSHLRLQEDFVEQDTMRSDRIIGAVLLSVGFCILVCMRLLMRRSHK